MQRREGLVGRGNDHDRRHNGAQQPNNALQHGFGAEW
jgi:hypothetical protein